MVSIRFDNNVLNNDAVLQLSYRGKLFNDSFKLGATLCKEFHLWVEKSYVSSHPNVVTIYNDGTLFATLHIDSIDESNDYYYDYTLLDSMIYLNQRFAWSKDDNKSVQTLVEEICSTYGITRPDRTYYLRNMVLNWEDYCSAREFIGYVAEMQGGYAYINPANKLVFAPFTNTSIATFLPDDIADLKVGDYHKITRVVYDNLVHYEWTATPNDGDTLYLNSKNLLFTDSGSFTIQAMVNHIGPIIGNFAFYNMKSSYIYLPKLPVLFTPGNMITVNGKNTILEADYTYNQAWGGGIDIDLKTAKQEETTIVNSDLEKAVNKIDVTLNRQDGIIDLMGQRVETVEGEIEEQNIHFQVDANKSEVRVTNENTYSPKAYTSFKGDLNVTKVWVFRTGLLSILIMNQQFS